MSICPHVRFPSYAEEVPCCSCSQLASNLAGTLLQRAARRLHRPNLHPNEALSRQSLRVVPHRPATYHPACKSASKQLCEGKVHAFEPSCDGSRCEGKPDCARSDISLIEQIGFQTFPVQYHDNLKYHLYAGSVAAVLGDYGLAIELLETVRSGQAV